MTSLLVRRIQADSKGRTRREAPLAGHSEERKRSEREGAGKFLKELTFKSVRIGIRNVSRYFGNLNQIFLREFDPGSG